jgi:hypothetical protein
MSINNPEKENYRNQQSNQNQSEPSKEFRKDDKENQQKGNDIPPTVSTDFPNADDEPIRGKDL